MTVGMREVEEKRKQWRASHPKKRSEFLGQHMLPSILGPKGRHFIIDHHHLAVALHREKVKDVLVTVVADLSALEADCFWVVLDHHAWVHPYDAKGRRCDFADIPKSVDRLADDPFRSLAGELRRVGGFAKDTTPFSEFLWADFLRRRLKRANIEHDFGAAVEQALSLAKGKEAGYLPGWCGATEDLPLH
jgi:hypothetical protein